MADYTLDQIKQLQERKAIFDALTPTGRTCGGCDAEIHEASWMSGDLADETGSLRRYHICNCEGILVVHDEVTADRPVPRRSTLDSELSFRGLLENAATNAA